MTTATNKRPNCCTPTPRARLPAATERQAAAESPKRVAERAVFFSAVHAVTQSPEVAITMNKRNKDRQISEGCAGAYRLAAQIAAVGRSGKLAATARARSEEVEEAWNSEMELKNNATVREGRQWRCEEGGDPLQQESCVSYERAADCSAASAASACSINV